MDQIRINDLCVEVSVGVYEWERAVKQPIHIDLVLDTDLGAASKSDRLEDAVDYTAIERAVIDIATGKHFDLIEKLAGDITEALLSIPALLAVRISVTKPNASVHAKSISVFLERRR